MGRYSRSRSRSRSSSPDNGCRVHVADLGDASKRDLEKACGKYGEIQEVWMAKGPPCFAFAVFKHREDAEDCIREMNGKMIRHNCVRVSKALPRTRGRGRRGFDPDMRCYDCGQRGHFSRDCDQSYGARRSYRASPSPPRFRRRSRSRSRERYTRRRSPSRSRSRDRRMSKSRSRSPVRQRNRSPIAAGRSRSRSP